MSASVEWMWGDVGMIHPWWRALAKENPLRWSLSMNFGGLASELMEQHDMTRAVLVRVYRSFIEGGEHEEFEFESVHRAAQWAHQMAVAETQAEASSCGRTGKAVDDVEGRYCVGLGMSCDETSSSFMMEPCDPLPAVCEDEAQALNGGDREEENPRWLFFLQSHIITAQSAVERVAPRVFDGILELMTSSRTEILLGKDGAAVLEHIIKIYRDHFQCNFPDLSKRRLLFGLLGLACLQHITNVVYGSRGALKSAASEGDPEWWEQSDSEACLAPRKEEELCALRRLTRIAAITYGRTHDQLLGSAPASYSDLCDGNVSALIRYLDLDSCKDILAAQWGSEGVHAPGYLLVADRKAPGSAHGDLVLAIRGTMSASDTLTDLRCEVGDVWCTHAQGSVERAHIGMWDSAVCVDAKVRDIIQDALAPGGPCEGMRLMVVGHSLGGGVASLLAIRWRSQGIFAHVKCVALAAPCIVSDTLARSAEDYITSVVLADDAVCRWSLGSTKDACKAAQLLTSRAGAVERLLRIRLVGHFPATDKLPASDESSHSSTDTQNADAVDEGRDAYICDKEGQDDDQEDDVTWCATLMEEVEGGMNAEKLVPAGRIMWLLHSPAPRSKNEMEEAESEDGKLRDEGSEEAQELAAFAREREADERGREADDMCGDAEAEDMCGYVDAGEDMYAVANSAGAYTACTTPFVAPSYRQLFVRALRPPSNKLQRLVFSRRMLDHTIGAYETALSHLSHS